MSDKSRLWCCFMDDGGNVCRANATFEIIQEVWDAAANFTHTCDYHLIAMLTDDETHTLISLN